MTTLQVDLEIYQKTAWLNVIYPPMTCILKYADAVLLATMTLKLAVKKLSLNNFKLTFAQAFTVHRRSSAC